MIAIKSPLASNIARFHDYKHKLEMNNFVKGNYDLKVSP